MEEIELLLSEEFVKFSQKITDIHKEKKSAQEEFKKIFDAYKANITALEAKAVQVQDDWESWKTTAGDSKKKK